MLDLFSIQWQHVLIQVKYGIDYIEDYFRSNSNPKELHTKLKEVWNLLSSIK